MNGPEKESNLVFYLTIPDNGPNSLRTLLNLSKLIYGGIPTYHFCQKEILDIEDNDDKKEFLEAALKTLHLPEDIELDKLPPNKKFLLNWILKENEERNLFLVECPSEILSPEEISWLKNKIIDQKTKSKIIFCGKSPEIWSDIIDRFVGQNDQYAFSFENNPLTVQEIIKAA